jgi:hypothetical protein
VQSLCISQYIRTKRICFTIFVLRYISQQARNKVLFRNTRGGYVMYLLLHLPIVINLSRHIMGAVSNFGFTTVSK